jgi:hypothetical protein
MFYSSLPMKIPQQASAVAGGNLFEIARIGLQMMQSHGLTSLVENADAIPRFRGQDAWLVLRSKSEVFATDRSRCSCGGCVAVFRFFKGGPGGGAGVATAK